MDKLKKINFPLLFIFLYLVKLLIVSSSPNDIGVMGMLVLAYIAILGKEVYTSYHNAKLSVVSENEFRNQVNQDMSQIKTELSNIKLTTGGGVPGFGKRR